MQYNTSPFSSVKLGRQCLEIMLVIAWDSVGSNCAAPSPPCLYYFACRCSLFGESSHQGLTRWWSSRRESCSGANWSVSSLKKKCREVQPIGTCALWNYRVWSKVPSQSKYWAKERCRSVVLFQTICFTICWKVIITFLCDDIKITLPTSALTPWKSGLNSLMVCCCHC